MHQVSIPDPLYVEAQRAAEANGVSVERFVREAVQLHLYDEAETSARELTPEQVAIIRQSQADIKAGKGMAIEQAKAERMAHLEEWLQANPH